MNADLQPPLPLHVRQLGRRPYRDCWMQMREFTDARAAQSADELWLVEHDPVYTLGLAGRAEHLLAPSAIDVVHCDRGGQITYHGPGQLVAYPLLDLRRRGIGVKGLVHRLEQAVIDVLEPHDVEAQRREGAPGVYVAGAKIAALGLRVRRGCSYHGLAFNVDMDLTPFAGINPCGYAGLAVTQVRDLVPGVDADQIRDSFVRHFVQRFGYVCA